MASLESQKNKVQRVFSWWSTPSTGNKDLLFMGEINLDFQKLNADDYSLKTMVDMTKELQADHALQQLVKEYTRMVNVSGVFKVSTIDHMYTNVEHLFTTPEVIHVGDSNH